MDVNLILEQLKPVLEAFTLQHNWFLNLVIIMGSMRVVMKPGMVLLKNIAKATPTSWDNEFLKKVEAHPAWIWFARGVDYLASIKLPKKELEKNDKRNVDYCSRR